MIKIRGPNVKTRKSAARQNAIGSPFGQVNLTGPGANVNSGRVYLNKSIPDPKNAG